MAPSVKQWFAAVVLLAVGLARAGDPGAAVDAPDVPQAAVLAGGFAIIDGTDGAREVFAYDRGGNPKGRTRFALPETSRVVGLARRTGLVWLTGGKIHVATVEPDGGLSRASTFGTRPTLLCAGAASSTARFAVGWLEHDGGMWIVQGDGPGAAILASEPGTILTSTERASWCTVTPAGDDVALLWRVGDRLFHTTCDRRCGRVTTLTLPLRDLRIADVGCVDGACAVVTGNDRTTIGWYTRAGTQRWRVDLPDATPTAHAALVGARQHVLVAYETATGLAIARAGANGGLVELWRGRGTLPTLAWANGSLLLGYRDRGGALGTIVLSVPN
ncbi:MAG: hypothetical protein NT062_04000 [Proteobacteria bacterium]|nr:hypothetical protein [Pseudomonadota bacterium]